MTSRLRIIVTGLIAQHPLLAGVTWDYLQYALGLSRLGHEVYYFEDSGQWPYTPDGGASGNEWIARDCAPNVDHLARVMARFGLADRWAYRFPTRPRWFGLSHRERRAVIESADLLINVSGTLRRPADYRRVKRLVYIDSDPAFTQVKLVLPRGHLKFRKRVNAHDVYFSFGEAFSSAVPDTGHRWRPTRQPMRLSRSPAVGRGLAPAPSPDDGARGSTSQSTCCVGLSAISSTVGLTRAGSSRERLSSTSFCPKFCPA